MCVYCVTYCFKDTFSIFITLPAIKQPICADLATGRVQNTALRRVTFVAPFDILAGEGLPGDIITSVRTSVRFSFPFSCQRCRNPGCGVHIQRAQIHFCTAAAYHPAKPPFLLRPQKGFCSFVPILLGTELSQQGESQYKRSL